MATARVNLHKYSVMYFYVYRINSLKPLREHLYDPRNSRRLYSRSTARFTSSPPRGDIAKACLCEEAENSSDQSTGASEASRRELATLWVASSAPRRQAWPARSTWPGLAAVVLGTLGTQSSSVAATAAPAPGAYAWDCGGGASEGGARRNEKTARWGRGFGSDLVVEAAVVVVPCHLASGVCTRGVGVPGILQVREGEMEGGQGEPQGEEAVGEQGVLTPRCQTKSGATRLVVWAPPICARNELVTLECIDIQEHITLVGGHGISFPLQRKPTKTDTALVFLPNQA